MATPEVRATEIIRTQLDLLAHRIASETAAALERDRLLADEDAVNAALGRAQSARIEAEHKVEKIRKRVGEHLGDPDTLAAMAETAMPWHDRLMHDLLNILDEGGP